MKPTVIISLRIFLIFSINLVCASNFDFHYSNISKINDEIIVTLINYNISDVQDIKLYIHNSSDDKIVRSEILSNTLNSGIWKDSWNYISSSFPDNLSYKIKLTSYSNNSSICVKLRKVNSSKTEELCKTFIQNLEPINSYKNLKPSKSSFSTDLENLRLGITLSSFILILLIFLILTLDIRDL